MASSRNFKSKEEFIHVDNKLPLRNVIGVQENPGETEKGVPSIILHKVTLPPPWSYISPHPHVSLKDKETRYR